MTKLYSISEASKLLKLVNPITKKPSNYVLRFWEKKFKDIKPILINKRRYYTKKNIEKFKLIKFLLKDRGLTINGAKIILDSKENSLDALNLKQLKVDYHKQNIKTKSESILEKIKLLKKNGKKNTY